MSRGQGRGQQGGGIHRISIPRPVNLGLRGTEAVIGGVSRPPVPLPMLTPIDLGWHYRLLHPSHHPGRQASRQTFYLCGVYGQHLNFGLDPMGSA